MKLLIKQRVFSWSDTYDVYDEQGTPKYFVQGEIFSMGHKIHIYNKHQQEIGMIRQKLFNFMPKYEIVIQGRVMGVVQKRFTFFSNNYDVDYNGWHVEGNFMGWDYDILSGCNLVSHISKELFHWGDTYSLYFQNAAHEIHGLLLVLAIDAANCGKS